MVILCLGALFAGFSAPAWCQNGGPQAVAPIREADKHPGFGTVVSIKEVVVREERSAASGGSAPREAPKARPAYRVGVRMADGSLEYRDLYKPEFRIGDDVLLTNAGEIMRD